MWHTQITCGFALQGIDGEWFSIKEEKDGENYCSETKKLFGNGSALHSCCYSLTKVHYFEKFLKYCQVHILFQTLLRHDFLNQNLKSLIIIVLK